ncbi:MAG TPA: tetratricopeptide repeat-containing sensor histidine kinase [Chitinophagaceae bacterium]|nr:tetratricopeptide repeat-containing sensor histidine kinase [Chitinophagaceae bacterium]
MEVRHLVRLAAWVFSMQAICYAQPQAASKQRLQTILLKKQVRKDYYKDTAYIDALNEMAHACFTNNADSIFRYANKALIYAKKAGYTRGEADAWRQLGNGYRLLGDYTNTLTHYFQSLTLAEKINDSLLAGKVCINIALEYIDMHKNDEALAMAARAKRYFEATNDGLYVTQCLIATGEIWLNRRQCDSAMHYFRQAYLVAESMKNEYLLISTNDEIASVLIIKGSYKEAISIYLRALDYYRHTNNDTRSAMAAADLAWAYLKLKQYRKALEYGHISLRISAAFKVQPRMLQVYSILADACKGLGDYRRALDYQSRFIQLSDTLSNEKIQLNTARVEARYEYEKKEALLKEEDVKKDIRHNAIVKEKELEVWFSATVIVFLSVLILLLFRSRAARKKINHELAAMNREIIRQKEKIEGQSYQLLLNNQQKDKLFGIISHDLKTPLHSLHTVLDLLKANALSETQLNRVIEELRHEVDYSSELVGNLLSWSNSQLNGMVANPVSLNLRALIAEVLQLSQKKAMQKQIVMGNLVHPSLQGYADKDMMHMIIRNLVCNAVKFCESGDAIIIDGKPTDDSIEICISDTGTGIEEDILDKINRRRIVTTYGTAGEKGTGLGLLLCRELIELNHGRLRVESEPGQGTRCSFTLPLPSHSA